MIFYCPNCWNEVYDTARVCPKCGEDVALWESKTYAAKLIQALTHPEPETQRRAVFLLGEKRIGHAIALLANLLRATRNPFLASDIVDALGKIGGPAAFSAISAALSHPSFTVRGAAAKALQNFPAQDPEAMLRRLALDDPSAYVREMAALALSARQAGGRRPAHG